MSRAFFAPAVWAVVALSSALPALADNAETANKSNNPLNLAPGLNLQDYYTPRLYDSNAHTNDTLLRGTLPIAPSDFIGVPQLLRATLQPFIIHNLPRGWHLRSTGTWTFDLKNNSAQALLATWVSDRNGLQRFAGDAPAVTDDRPRIEYAPWVRPREISRVDGGNPYYRWFVGQ